MEESLRDLGLTDGQIEAYVYLLDNGATAPPRLAKRLGITRTNAYKLLDRLVELGLATRQDVDKKLTYKAEDPIALTDLLAVERNKMIKLERGVKDSMQTLRAKYNRQNDTVTEVKRYSGAARLKQLYERQASLDQPVYFVASLSDIPTLGYATMNYVRHLPKQRGQQRYGIVPDHAGGPANPEIDKRTNLNRTWLANEEYHAPVEWSVAGDEVTIFIFEKLGSAIHIKNQAVADSLRQLWHVMDRHIRADPGYASLPRKASRNV